MYSKSLENQLEMSKRNGQIYRVHRNEYAAMNNVRRENLDGPTILIKLTARAIRLKLVVN